jgi:ferrous iron transport protein B
MSSEMKSAKWFWGGIGFQLGVGFTVSFLVYQMGTLVTTGSFGKGFIGGLIAVLVFVFIIVTLILKANKKLKEEKANKIKKQTVTK